MVLPRDAFQSQIQSNVLESWRQLLCSMKEAVDSLEKGIAEASEMREVCTDEWCVATEHVIDELSNALFSISEPRWTNDEDSRRLKELKWKMHELYARYKSVTRH